MRSALVALVLIVVAGATGCARTASDGEPTIVASFYPLAWAVERVAVPGSEVANMTPPGVEPHDLELSPRDIEKIRSAKLVVYVGGGFQPAIEDAVESRDGPSLDVLREGEDPHVWLDPVRFSEVVERIAVELGTPGAARPTVRALRRLDAEYRSGLADCERRVFVTTHDAFGWLASRYGLTEIPIASRSPEAEPSPRDLERIIREVRDSGATTVFTEPLVSSRVAETVAREAGAEVAILDPVEGLSEERLAAGEDYLSAMRRNLETLREALGCR